MRWPLAWPRGRKPGTCTNSYSLPIGETDNAVLDIIEGEMLSPRHVNELLALVDQAEDETPRLMAQRDRLRAEVANLVGSLAAGVPADTWLRPSASGSGPSPPWRPSSASPGQHCRTSSGGGKP